MNKEQQFYEWILGRGPFPFYQDNITVPYPIGFEPLVKQIERHSHYKPAKKIAVKYIPSEEKLNYGYSWHGPKRGQVRTGRQRNPFKENENE